MNVLNTIWSTIPNLLSKISYIAILLKFALQYEHNLCNKKVLHIYKKKICLN